MTRITRGDPAGPASGSQRSAPAPSPAPAPAPARSGPVRIPKPADARDVPSSPVKILVNGEAREVPDGSTVAALLGVLGLAGRPLAVERNGEIVPRSAHAAAALAEGDRIEVVTMVGGG